MGTNEGSYPKTYVLLMNTINKPGITWKQINYLHPTFDPNLKLSLMDVKFMA